MEQTERDRLELRQRLSEALGERSTDVLMQALPPIDYEELATRADLDILRRELSAEFAAGEANLRTDVASIRTDMASQLRILVITHVATMIGLAGFVAGLS